MSAPPIFVVANFVCEVSLIILHLLLCMKSLPKPSHCEQKTMPVDVSRDADGILLLETLFSKTS